jgi:hypothetical protein
MPNVSPRRATAVLSLVLITCLLALTPSTAHGAVAGLRSFPLTRSNVHRFVGIQGDVGHSFSASELTAIGRSADIVMGLEQQIKKYGPKLRAVHPHIRLFVYVNGMFAQSSQGRTFPHSWYLHDAHGNQIRSHTHGNFLMNPLSTSRYGGRKGWAHYVAHTCVSKVKAARIASGCFLDQTSSAGNSSFVTARPIDPRTGKPFGMVAYMKAVNHVINTAAAHVRVIANSYESGPRFFQNHTRLVNRSRGAAFEAEHWMGVTQPRDASTLSKWKQDVQMLIDSQRSGHGALVRFGDASTNLSRWEAFVVCTMLLGNAGHTWVQFESSASSPQAWQINDPIFNVRIGKPLRTARKVRGYLHNGVYRRRFTKGVVLVNPRSSTVRVTLSRRKVTLGGSSVRAVSLPPLSGMILLNPA